MPTLRVAGCGLFSFALTFPLAAQSLLRQHGEIVLASGMQLPGFPVGAEFAASSGASLQPVINGDGLVAFRARARFDAAVGIDADNAHGWFVGRDAATLQLVARQGDPAPGLPTTTRLQNTPAAALPLRQLRLAPRGEQMLLVAGLADAAVPANTPGTSDSALFAGTPGNLQLVAREGTAVPGLGTARFGEIDASLQGLVLGSDGTLVFRNQLQVGVGGVTAANDALWMVGTPGNLQVLLREGDPWNGVGAAGELLDRFTSASIGEFPASVVQRNEAGQLLHDVHFVVPSGSATSAANDRALVRWSGGVGTIVVREGQQAPGMPAGVSFADASATSPFFLVPSNALAADGDFLFVTLFPSGPGGVTTANDRALYGTVGGTLTLLVREGSPAPAQLGAGVTFGQFGSNVIQNDAGVLVFASPLAGAVAATDDSALFVGVPGSFLVIAREGQPAAGMPGFVYGELQPSGMAISARRSVLFAQPVTDGTTTLTAWFRWTFEHGTRLWFDPREAWTTSAGTSTQPVLLGASVASSGDTVSTLLNGDGEFAGMLLFQGTDAATLGFAHVRGHAGALVGTPASVPATGGVPQTFALDAGPGQAGQIYFLLASSLGTRPGFPSPLGPQTIPLNFDPLWTLLSIQAPNSPIWVGSIGITDAQGRGGPAAFVLPTGLPGLQGTTLHHAAVLFDGSLNSTYVTEPVGLRLR